MSLPIRERIIQKLAARTGASRRLAMYDERDLPITVISEGDGSAIESRYGMTTISLPLVFGRALNMDGVKDDQWYTTLNTELANLVGEIWAGDDDDLEDLIEGIDYVSDSVDVLTDAASGGGVAVTVNVRFAFVSGKPDSQDNLADYDETETGDPAP